MSYTSNFLKALQTQEKDDTNIADGGTPSADQKQVTGAGGDSYTRNFLSYLNGSNSSKQAGSSKTDTYTKNFLSAMEQESTPTVSDRAATRAQEIKENLEKTSFGKMVSSAMDKRATTSGGFYSWSGQSGAREKLYDNVKEINSELKKKRIVLGVTQTCWNRQSLICRRCRTL